MKPDESKIIVKNKSNKQENIKLIAKLMHLSVGQKAGLFIMFMGVLGAVIGKINAEVEIRGCTSPEQCFMADTAQTRLDGIGKGGFAGMGTAVFASLPALQKRLRQ